MPGCQALGCGANGQGVISGAKKSENINNVGAIDRDTQVFDFTFFNGKIQNIALRALQIEVGVSVMKIGHKQGNALPGK